MSQCLRVARWIPIDDPISVGQVIRVANAPGATETVPSAWGTGTGMPASFATDADVITGTEPFKAISPLTLRNEFKRLLAMPDAMFADVIATAAPAGVVDAGKLLKLDASGNANVQVTLDGGTF